MSDILRKPLFEEEPIESQLEIFKLAEEFLNIQNQINQKGAIFEFSKSPCISVVGESSVQKVFKVAEQGRATETAHLGKVRHGIETLEKHVEEQKEMKELLRECSDLNEAAKKVMEDPLSDAYNLGLKRRRRQLENCDKLEEHALKILRTCKRLKGTEE